MRNYKLIVYDCTVAVRIFDLTSKAYNEIGRQKNPSTQITNYKKEAIKKDYLMAQIMTRYFYQQTKQKMTMNVTYCALREAAVQSFPSS